MKRGLKLLILSDLMILMGFGFISPLLPIFIKDELFGGSKFAAGLSIAIFLLTKSISQIPFGKIEDKHYKRRFLLIGTYMIAFAPLGYYLSNNVIHLYIIQFFYGIGAAMAFPAFGVLFMRFMDHGKEAYDWRVYGTVVGLGTAITALMGGFIAQNFSFTILFIVAFIMAFIGAIILNLIPKEHIVEKLKKGPR